MTQNERDKKFRIMELTIKAVGETFNTAGVEKMFAAIEKLVSEEEPEEKS